jgi:hypothetical protein
VRAHDGEHAARDEGVFDVIYGIETVMERVRFGFRLEAEIGSSD